MYCVSCYCKWFKQHRLTVWHSDLVGYDMSQRKGQWTYALGVSVTLSTAQGHLTCHADKACLENPDQQISSSVSFFSSKVCLERQKNRLFSYTPTNGSTSLGNRRSTWFAGTEEIRLDWDERLRSCCKNIDSLWNSIYNYKPEACTQCFIHLHSSIFIWLNIQYIC